ncbi:MAG: efflux RND transporter periplasmic adaptor subunit [Bacteroidia bacterium]|nr:efflux RND transporter periplasmic adaptor subunit [Bacteroidia bacterium]
MKLHKYISPMFQLNNYPVFFGMILNFFVLSGCSEKSASNAGEAEHGHEEEGVHENALTASLTAAQIKSIGIVLGNIEKKQLTASLRANGLLKVPNQNRATISTMADGVVKSILVQPGNSVRIGQIIATLSGTSIIAMQEEYLAVSARVLLSESDFYRQQELQKGNATSAKVYQQSEADLKSLKARKSGLQKQLELVGISVNELTSENFQSSVNITSPINGVVSDVLVNIGSFVEANNPIATIVDNSQLHLDLYVYEKDLSKLKEGQTIHFTLTNNPGKEYDAKIYAISNTFESNSKAVSVHAQVLGDKSGLIDGMSITAIVSLSETAVDAVPTESIVSFEGQDFIFVVSDAHNEEEHHGDGDGHNHDEHGHEHKDSEISDKKMTHEHEDGESHAEHSDSEEVHETNVTSAGMLTFERIPVAKGTTDIGYSEITLLKDIPANAQIVTKGAFFVLGKMTNAGEGHEH